MIKIRDTSNDKNNASAGYVYNKARQTRLDGNTAHNCSHSFSNSSLSNSVNSTNTENGTRTDNREAVEILPNHRDVEPIKLVENGTLSKPIRVIEQNGTKSDLVKLILNESTASDGGRKENVTAIPTNSTSNATLARQEVTTESASENGTKSAGSDTIEIIKSISVEYPESISSGSKFGPYGGSLGNFGAVSSSSFSKNTHHRGSTVSKIIDLSEGDGGFGQQYDNLYSFGEGFGLKNAEVKTEKRRKPSRKPPRSEKQTVKVESSSKKSRGRGRSKKSQEKVKVPSVSASDINSMLFWNDSPSGRRLTANDATVESTDWDGNRFSFDVAVGDE